MRDLVENPQRMKANVTVLPDPSKTDRLGFVRAPGVKDWMRDLLLDWRSPDDTYEALGKCHSRRVHTFEWK